MESIFEYENYKQYLQDWMRSSPRSGRGSLTLLARAAKLPVSNLSVIMSGARDLNLEQANGIAEWIGLSEGETEFLFVMVELARAGSAGLINRLKTQLKRLAGENRKLCRRLPVDRALSPSETALFNSEWYYCAIHLHTFIPGMDNADSIAERLNLPYGLVKKVLQLLVKHGLCIEKKGRVLPALNYLHLGADSSLANRIHAMWRLKAMERHPVLDLEKELAFSGQMTLSVSEVVEVRKVCRDMIEKIRKRADPSPNEVVYCLNVDWLELR